MATPAHPRPASEYKSIYTGGFFLQKKKVIFGQGSFKAKDHSPVLHIAGLIWILDPTMMGTSGDFSFWGTYTVLLHRNLMSSMWSFCLTGLCLFLFFPLCLEIFEMLITSPPLFSPPSLSLSLSLSPDSSSNYIRQLETKVRILEDDNNKLLSQVKTYICIYIPGTYAPKKPTSTHSRLPRLD